MSGIGGVGRGGFDRLRNDASSSGQMAAVPSAPAPEAQIVRGSAPGAPVRATPAPIADPKVAALVQAMRTQGPADLEKTLAAAKKQDPTSYRSAVREFFQQIDFHPSKLMAHIMAMDANNDGKLTFSESYHTMHDMGFSATRAAMLSGLTAVALAPQTTGKFGFVLDVKNADKTNRAFFRNAFDTEEKLEERLDQLMSEDLDKDGFLTQKDFDRIVDKRTAAMDSKLGGKIVNYLNKSEWQALLKMMDNNRINRAELKDFYNSSLFFSLLEPDNLAKKLVAYRAGKV